MNATKKDVQSRLIRPQIDSDSANWWDGMRVGEIRLPHCQECDQIWFPPSPGCPYCGSTNWSVVLCSGAGHLYSWVVVHRSLDDEYAEDVPYVIGTVQLDEGPRVFARIIEIDPESLQPDAQLEAIFYEVEDFHLLAFHPPLAKEGRT